MSFISNNVLKGEGGVNIKYKKVMATGDTKSLDVCGKDNFKKKNILIGQ